MWAVSIGGVIHVMLTHLDQSVEQKGVIMSCVHVY